MSAGRRPGPGFVLERDGWLGWLVRVWDGQGGMVEVHTGGSREQARRQAMHELRQLVGARGVA